MKMDLTFGWVSETILCANLCAVPEITNTPQQLGMEFSGGGGSILCKTKRDFQRAGEVLGNISSTSEVWTLLELPNDNMTQTWFAKPLICRVITLALLFKFPRKKDCDVPLFK